MEIDVGVCKEHDRPYEGLCKNCECVICPSCVMFGSHKKHDIVSLREGAMYLRKAIDQGTIEKRIHRDSHIRNKREQSYNGKIKSRDR